MVTYIETKSESLQFVKITFGLSDGNELTLKLPVREAKLLFNDLCSILSRPSEEENKEYLIEEMR